MSREVHPHHRTRVAYLLAGLALVAACVDEPAGPLPPEPSFSRMPAAPPAQTRGRGIESEFADVERRVPGFGGFYISESGDIVAYVTNLTRRSEVIAAITDSFVNDADEPGRFNRDDGSPRSIEVIRADYTISELITWTLALRGAAREMPTGISLLDADEASNRVRVGVRHPAFETTVRLLALSLGIPPAALVFEAAGNIQASALLTDDVRNTRGGYKVQNAVGGGTCTMGFKVYKVSDNTPYFLTTSHCLASGNFNGTTGQPFYQNGSAASDSVGRVALNPAWSTSGCAVGSNYCRLTDIAMVAYNGVAAGSDIIAQSSTVGTGNNAGNTTVGPLYNVSVQASAPAVGDSTYKTGSTTGTTKGVITGTCLTNLQYWSAGGALVENDCAYRSTHTCSGGDSGSPVYRYVSGMSADTRQPMGILFACDSATSPHKTYWNWTGSIDTDVVDVKYVPPVYVNINGPDQVLPDLSADECMWYSSVTGGYGSKTYEWKKNGVVVGSNAYWTDDTGTSDFTLTLTASDVSGSDTDILYVDVDAGADECVGF